MPISNEHVKKIETFTADLGDLIKHINPITDKEWDAFNKLVDAHKNLMKVDTDSLRQLPLPLPDKPVKKAKPRKDCPRCAGTGLWVDHQDPKHQERVCNCNEVGDIPWPAIKKEWQEALAPVGA